MLSPESANHNTAKPLKCQSHLLTTALKKPITTAAETILKYTFLLFIFFFSEKIMLEISCESFVRQMINIKRQALFSLKKTKQKQQQHNFF